MRVAILYCGQMRTFDHPIPVSTIEQYLTPFNPDIFVATWSNRGISFAIENNHHQEESLTISAELLNAHYPKLITSSILDFNSWLEKLDPELAKMYVGIKDTWGQPVTAIPWFNQMYIASQLKQQHESTHNFKYDVVLVTRPDIWILGIPAFQEMKANTIYHTNIGRVYWPNRIYANFFYGSSSNIDDLLTAWLDIKTLFQHPFNNGLDYRDPCRLLYIQACNKGINVETMPKYIADPYRFETMQQLITGMNI